MKQYTFGQVKYELIGKLEHLNEIFLSMNFKWI